MISGGRMSPVMVNRLFLLQILIKFVPENRKRSGSLGLLAGMAGF